MILIVASVYFEDKWPQENSGTENSHTLHRSKEKKKSSRAFEPGPATRLLEDEKAENLQNDMLGHASFPPRYFCIHFIFLKTPSAWK